MKTRREFISTCGSCFLAAGTAITLLESFSFPQPLKTVDGDEFTVPLSSFENKSAVVVNHAVKGEILVRKNDDGSFMALRLVCTHRNGKVVESGKQLKCTKHGSLFNLDGSVKSGKATENLEQFETSVSGANVVISIP